MNEANHQQHENHQNPENHQSRQSPDASSRLLKAKAAFGQGPSSFTVFFDGLILTASYFLGALLSPWADIIFSSNQIYVACAVHVFLVVAAKLGLGYYELLKRFKLVNLIGNAAFAQIIGYIGSVAIVYLVFYESFGRLGSLVGSIVSYVVLLGAKLFIRHLVLQSPIKVALVGSSQLYDELFRSLDQPRSLFKPKRFSGDDGSAMGLSSLVDECVRESYSVLVVPISDLKKDQNTDFAFSAREHGLEVVSDLEFFGVVFSRYPVSSLSKDTLMSLGFLRQHPLYEFSKRLLDIVLAGFGLILSLPLFLCIAFLIKVSSRGGVFYNQARMGRNLRPFKMYKFRTMYTRSAVGSVAGGFTQEGDVRVTWTGRILRPLHLDELPQLLNILRGDMSIVGVRPEAQFFAEKMQKAIPFYYLRYFDRPGLTGHAQLSMGYALDTVEDTELKISYDLFYLTKKSALNDLRIMIKTVFFLAKKSR